MRVEKRGPDGRRKRKPPDKKALLEHLDNIVEADSERQL